MFRVYVERERWYIHTCLRFKPNHVHTYTCTSSLNCTNILKFFSNLQKLWMVFPYVMIEALLCSHLIIIFNNYFISNKLLYSFHANYFFTFYLLIFHNVRTLKHNTTVIYVYNYHQFVSLEFLKFLYFLCGLLGNPQLIRILKLNFALNFALRWLVPVWSFIG